MKNQKIILSVKDLNIKFNLRGRQLHAIRGVSLDVYEGESLAIVGESGSGKSVFTKTFMGLLDVNGFVDSGRIIYNGTDIANFTEKEWLKIRGKEIAMVLQDPMTSLNPLKTIGAQIGEAIWMHQGLKGDALKSAVVEILKDVGITEPERRAKQYPHEFSGGMRQRVVIAIAVACRPRILICDEPTTALDVTIQAQVLDLFRTMQQDEGLGLLYVTHDLAVVAQLCSSISVMKDGQIIERGVLQEVFDDPQEEYTRRLLTATPRIDEGLAEETR